MASKGMELFLASADGDADRVKRLLLEGANVNYHYDLGDTPCSIAIVYGNTTVVEILLANGADFEISAAGWTFCHIATYYGYLDTLKVLISYGAVFDSPNMKGQVPYDFTHIVMSTKTVSYLNALVIAIDNVRSIVCLIIGTRKKGDLQVFPKEIVKMLAQYIWKTRRSVEWLE